MTIPSVMHGLIETDGGTVFELDSPKGSAWLKSIGSFRFEPVGDNKPYTVRKESGKGGDYWYGYRKQNGKLHKKYIGKSSEVSTAKLEEIAEALNTPPQARVTDKVTEVTDRSERVVTDKVTDARGDDRLTALELQVQLLQESLEALRSELPGKSDAGNFEELPTAIDSELQIEIGNLQVTSLRLEMENQSLKEELERAREGISSQAFIIKDGREREWKFEEEIEKLRSQLATEQTRWADLLEELQAREKTCASLQGQLADRDKIIAEMRSELSDLKQKSAPARDLPDAADLLNQLKAKRKKSKTDLADIEAILAMIEG